MFGTSGLDDQIRALDEEKARLQQAVMDKNRWYDSYVYKEMLLYLRPCDTSKIEKISSDMRSIIFKSGLVATRYSYVGDGEGIEYTLNNKSIAQQTLSRGLTTFCKNVSVEYFIKHHAMLLEALAVSDDILLGRPDHWRNVIQPTLTPETLSSLYCACAVRWVAGQFPSMPLEDALVGCVIPRIVFGIEISHDQNKTKVV
jgi:hypothetical protein